LKRVLASLFGGDINAEDITNAIMLPDYTRVLVLAGRIFAVLIGEIDDGAVTLASDGPCLF